MRRILVVEDSGAMRALIGAALEDLDEKLEVDEAESGFAALRLLPRTHYDLIVTDINMPRMDGLTLLEHLADRDLNNRCRIYGYWRCCHCLGH